MLAIFICSAFIDFFLLRTCGRQDALCSAACGSEGGSENDNGEDILNDTQEDADASNNSEVSEAIEQPVVPEDPPSPLSNDFVDYLRTILEEVNTKASENSSAAADANEEKADASILQEREEKDVSLAEVVGDVAKVLANALEPDQVQTVETSKGAHTPQRWTTPKRKTPQQLNHFTLEPQLPNINLQ